MGEKSPLQAIEGGQEASSFPCVPGLPAADDLNDVAGLPSEAVLVMV